MQTVETLNEGLKRAYRITIPAKDIDARVDRELKKVAPRVRMPGFRPGKVPANLVRKMHGAQMEQEALSSAVQEGVQKLLTEQRLRPAMQPAVALEAHESGKDAIVKVELETLPEVPEAKIGGLKLERLRVEADDAAVDEALQKLLAGQKNFTAAPAKHAAKLGDLVIIDFEGKVGGKPFEGGKGEGMSAELGAGRMIPGFEDQLVGAKANEQRTLEVTFPKDYPVDYLKGKKATFEVTVNEVRVANEATADDDFAQSMGLESLDQLRGLLKGQIEQELNGLTRTHMKRKLLDQLAASHDFPVPATMVEAEFNQIWQQLEQEASREPDPAAARAEMEAEREEYRAIAERRVRLGLLLSDIGARNRVDVSEQEMNQLVMGAAQQYRPEDREKFVQYVRQNPMVAAQIRAPLFEDKVVDFLFSNAEVTERAVTREQLEAEIESEDFHVHGPDCDHDHDHSHAHGDAAGAEAAAQEVAKPTKKSKGKAGSEPAKAKAAPKKAAPKKATAEPAAAEQTAAEKPAKNAGGKKKPAAASEGAAQPQEAPAAQAGTEPAKPKKRAPAKKGKGEEQA